MKSVISILALAAVFSSHAFAADEMKVIVSCQDARTDMRDEGYSVTITDGGIAGKMMAVVSEQSIAGPRLLGTFVVDQDKKGTELTYSASGFELKVELESFAKTSSHPATMYMRKIVQIDIATAINVNLNCTLN